MPNSVLQEALIEAQLKRKTGKIQIIGTFQGSSKSASIDLNEGRVIAIRFGSDKGGPAMEPIAHMSLSRVLFMKSSGIDSNSAPDTPTMQELLDQLAGTVVLKKEVPDDASLISRVVEILKPSFGARAPDLVSSIALSAPPSTDLAVFVHMCKAEAAKMVGDKQAEQLFSKFERRSGGRSSDTRGLGDDLFNEARRILTSALGPSSREKVKQISEKVPPGQYPERFIQACVELAEPMMGQRGAEKLFIKFKT